MVLPLVEPEVVPEPEVERPLRRLPEVVLPLLLRRRPEVLPPAVMLPLVLPEVMLPLVLMPPVEPEVVPIVVEPLVLMPVVEPEVVPIVVEPEVVPIVVEPLVLMPVVEPEPEVLMPPVEPEVVWAKAGATASRPKALRSNAVFFIAKRGWRVRIVERRKELVDTLALAAGCGARRGATAGSAPASAA